MSAVKWTFEYSNTGNGVAWSFKSDATSLPALPRRAVRKLADSPSALGLVAALDQLAESGSVFLR